MATHIQLFGKPLAFSPDFPPLSVVGVLPNYTSGVAYEGRLDIINAIGKCKVEFVSGQLPPGYRLYVDNFAEQVVLDWPAYSDPLGEPSPVPNGNFEAGDDGSWTMDYGWSIDEDNDPRTGSWNARLIKTGDNMMLRGTPVPVPAAGFNVIATGYIQQGASAEDRARCRMELVWRAGDGTELQREESRLVRDGDGGDWSDEQTLVTAEGITPINAATIAVEFRGWRTVSKRSLGVDDVTWNVPYAQGTNSDEEFYLTLKVTDSANRVAYWSGILGEDYLYLTSKPYPTDMGADGYVVSASVQGFTIKVPPAYTAPPEAYRPTMSVSGLSIRIPLVSHTTPPEAYRPTLSVSGLSIRSILIAANNQPPEAYSPTLSVTGLGIKVVLIQQTQPTEAYRPTLSVTGVTIT